MDNFDDKITHTGDSPRDAADDTELFERDASRTDKSLDIESVEDPHSHPIGGTESYETDRGGLRCGDYPDPEQTRDSDLEAAASSHDRRYDSAETRFGVSTHDNNLYSETSSSEYSSRGANFSSRRGDERLNENWPSISDVGSGVPAASSAHDEHIEREHGNSTTTKYDDQNVAGNDSTTGKLLEKVGGILESEKLSKKGREKRDAATYDDDQSEY